MGATTTARTVVWMRVRDLATLRAVLKSAGERGMSYQLIAKEAEVSKGFIGQLATGHRTTLTPLVAYRIAEALGVKPEVIFEANARSAGGRASSPASDMPDGGKS
jgi:transcriptional regulator with XRE-family HTH domain